MKEQEEKSKLKYALWEACAQKQQKQLDISKEAMLSAQETANDEKGTMGDKFESFREQMQIDRDMYARQYDEGLKVMEGIKRIDPEKANNNASVGAIVFTSQKDFYISVSLGQVVAEGKSFVAISPSSPLFQSMAGMKAGEEFNFRDAKIKIKDIW